MWRPASAPHTDPPSEAVRLRVPQRISSTTAAHRFVRFRSSSTSPSSTLHPTSPRTDVQTRLQVPVGVLQVVVGVLEVSVRAGYEDHRHAEAEPPREAT